MTDFKAPAQTYYSLLGLSPSASVQHIRRAYRDRSKLYHPDTTDLPPEVAKAKFQQLNEAYATLSNPERRIAYDQKIGYSRIHVMQAPAYLNQPVSRTPGHTPSHKAYLDPSDRPLSAGEVFALFLLGVTFVACLALVITLGITQGEAAFHLPSSPETAVISPPEPAPVDPAEAMSAPVTLNPQPLPLNHSLFDPADVRSAPEIPVPIFHPPLDAIAAPDESAPEPDPATPAFPSASSTQPIDSIP